jgi:hypothetical protein
MCKFVLLTLFLVLLSFFKHNYVIARTIDHVCTNVGQRGDVNLQIKRSKAYQNSVAVMCDGIQVLMGYALSLLRGCSSVVERSLCM